jgi:hypothetical protein
MLRMCLNLRPEQKPWTMMTMTDHALQGDVEGDQPAPSIDGGATDEIVRRSDIVAALFWALSRTSGTG